MAVAIQIFPKIPAHSSTFELFVSGLKAGDTYAIYTNNVTTASSAATGTADSKGNLAVTVTSGSPTGLWFLNVIDTQGGGHVLVGQASFTQS